MNDKTLHEILCEVLGSRNCYYSPPATIKMKYPCIVYRKTNEPVVYADNKPYFISVDYLATIIDPDPDSEIPRRLLTTVPYCTFDRTYTVDGLVHSAYRISFAGPRYKKEDQNEKNDDIPADERLHG